MHRKGADLVVKDRIDSRHLAGNLLGDPSERDLYIYLPPTSKGSNRRYATAYLLLGYGLQPKDMFEPEDSELGGAGPMHSIADLLDLQFFREPSTEMIVVVVDGWTKYGGSQYVNSPVNGNFESFAVEEVVPYVDEHFPSIPRADSRAVFGYSSGGFGAWHLGSRHPDVFGAMALLSADSYFELSHLSLLYKYFNSLYPAKRLTKDTDTQQLDGCTGSPKVEDSGSLRIKSAANCKAGTRVTYYTLVDGGHEWPRSATLSATKLIWRFFAAKVRG